MIFSWFDATEAKKLGAALAELLIERTPGDVSSTKNKLLTKKHEAMLHQLSHHVTQFRVAHKLNTYKKAQVGNTFKWILLDKGYDREYVDQLTNWLMREF